jgi:tetratricopeptide (TPR) repeat protein
MDRAVAAAQAPALSARERRHVDALALWVGGRGNDAIPLIREILAEHPRDMMLIQRLYYIHFCRALRGDAGADRVGPGCALDGDSYMLGLHAFSLEENGRYAEALPLAERAVGMNPKDAWAVHAIAHVLYETGRTTAAPSRCPLASIPATT